MNLGIITDNHIIFSFPLHVTFFVFIFVAIFQNMTYSFESVILIIFGITSRERNI